jgi:hypothetical protein
MAKWRVSVRDLLRRLLRRVDGRAVERRERVATPAGVPETPARRWQPTPFYKKR